MILKTSISFDCNLFITVDGAYTPWSDWSLCSNSCGNGTKVRYRTCSNPAPANNGQDCIGGPIQTENCVGTSCPGTFSCHFAKPLAAVSLISCFYFCTNITILFLMGLCYSKRMRALMRSTLKSWAQLFQISLESSGSCFRV